MQWLNKVVSELIAGQPEDKEFIVSSGVSPSGTYHLGTLREVLTAEAIAWELKRRGRKARHLHIVDDLDVFRKIPAGLPEGFKEYLGKPLCDVPSPQEGSTDSYADYYLRDLLEGAQKMGLDIEIVRAHEKYRSGFFAEAIELSLEQKEEIKGILESVSGHKVDDNWSPVQVIEDGYLKNRPLVSFDKDKKTLVYKDKNDQDREQSYTDGSVKLNWRVDWPARWWLLGVDVEPFGRDHATKGGSYDTGSVLAKDVFNIEPPLPLPYNFINRTGDTKKMSKSAGDTITVAELLEVLPAEVVWFFVLRYSPDKLLFFDVGATLIRIVDEFGELLSKTDKTEDEQQLLDLCMHGLNQPTVSRVPFSLLVSAYQAALKNPDTTLEIISRTEYKEVADEDGAIIKQELSFIDNWLTNWAPEEIKFELSDHSDPTSFSDAEKRFLGSLADKIETAPDNADGAWFHQAVYELKGENDELSPKDMFATLYRALINKQSGPRAGWFLSILPRDWLIKRLRLEA